MGRKIKGRKHRGINDPEEQRQKKFLSIQDKINRPPINPDDQQIPKSLSHIISLKEKVQNGLISVKRKRKSKKPLGPVTSHPHGIKSNLDVPFFQQETGESDKQFMGRVKQICNSVIEEASFADKYGIDINRNPQTGQVENVTKRKVDELELYLKQVKKEKKLKGKGKKKVDIGLSSEPKLTKSQKRRTKLKKKKEEKAELNKDEFKTFEDDVKFGEIVHGPPSLSAPRKIKVEGNLKPGRKKLLLNALINPGRNDDQSKTGEEVKLKKIANKVIDRKGKRKEMPHALRRQLDRQQKEVIDAYKALKAERYNTNK